MKPSDLPACILDSGAESAEAGASAPRRCRTIWLSDTHLGTAGCKAEYLLDFLRHHDCETLYLVGDIVDGWQLRKGWYLPRAHNDVVQKLLRKARKGTRVVFVPGNHDEFARQFVGLAFGDIDVVEEAIHVTADGRRLVLNHWFNRLRSRLGLCYWSLSQSADTSTSRRSATSAACCIATTATGSRARRRSSRPPMGRWSRCPGRCLRSAPAWRSTGQFRPQHVEG